MCVLYVNNKRSEDLLLFTPYLFLLVLFFLNFKINVKRIILKDR